VSGVHLIAILAAVATIAVIVELSRRRQLREKYALVWMTVGVVMAVFAISLGLFNSLAHSVGVKNPPDLLTVLACIFLLVVCVQFSWEMGRMEDRSRLLAEEVALLRNQIENLRRHAEEASPASAHDE
jgi:hypothetical protein